MAAERLKTVDIKGKKYVMVNERLRYFREHYPEFSLVSEIVELTPERICMEAKILDGNGRLAANGHAFEEKQGSYINKTSYIENCETSAWGRALANFGIGIDDSVGSADEVAHAMALQENGRGGGKRLLSTVQVGELLTLAMATHTNVKSIAAHYGVEQVNQLSEAQYQDALEQLRKKEKRGNAEPNPAAELDALLDRQGEEA